MDAKVFLQQESLDKWTGERERESRTARVIQRDPASKTKTKTKTDRVWSTA